MASTRLRLVVFLVAYAALVWAVSANPTVVRAFVAATAVVVLIAFPPVQVD